MSQSPSNDWPRQATDTIERLVTTVRDRATGPAITVIRAVVFGVMAIFLGILAIVLLAIASVRLLDSYLPGKVWAAHLATGGLFSLAGTLLFSKRYADQ